MVLHHFGIPKWGACFETVLHHFGTPSLAPFQNGAATFLEHLFLHFKIWMAMVSTGNAASYAGALPIVTFSLAFASVDSKFA